LLPSPPSQEVEWQVTRRYSQFLDLKTRMEKETIKTSVVFPKKGFGTLSKAQMEKRREQVRPSSHVHRDGVPGLFVSG
jgi:hypothetical protein